MKTILEQRTAAARQLNEAIETLRKDLERMDPATGRPLGIPYTQVAPKLALLAQAAERYAEASYEAGKLEQLLFFP